MISELAQFCEGCGAALAANTKFCQGCGKPVAAKGPMVPSQSAPLNPPVPAPIPAPVTPSQPISSNGQTISTSQLYGAQKTFAIPPTLGAPPVSANLDNYTRLKQLYNQAAQVDPMQRDAFLVSMCSGDASMLQELRSMFVTASASFTGVQRPTVVESSSSANDTGSATQSYTIGVYKLLRELGRGGMGVVYLAVRDDGAFRKNVALKLLLSEHVNAEFVSRFKQERQVLAALDHPNIARILDGGDTPDGMPYYVMEYVEGLPLDRYCDQQRLTLTGRIKLFQQVCLAVDYLHQNSILHRDLKPSNILVSSDGIVKLLDFGIAKVVGAAAWASPDLTNAQGRPMTPTYASPEQLSGATLHKTSDLYSLGAILYNLLTGRSPYNDLDDKLTKIGARELPSAPSTNIREDLKSAETTAQFRRAMMGELDSIVLMTMQIDPKDRYQSASDLAQDLQRFLDGSPVTAYHTSAGRRSIKLLLKKKTAIAVLCGFLVLGAFGAWEGFRLERQKEDAAANNAHLNGLIDQLNGRLDKASPSAPPIDDVRQLKDAFRKDFTPSADHNGVLAAKGVKYLDNVHAVDPANPKLNEQVGDAYSQMGTYQEKAPAPNSNKTALATYEKAANSLASASNSGGGNTEQAKQRLANVNAHIRDLGGAPVPLHQEAAAPQPNPTPAPPPDQPQPIQPAPARKVVQPHPVVEAPPVQQVTTPPVEKAPAGVSADTEERLSTVESKVQIADQTIAPVKQSLERDGQTLNADTLTRMARMHASLDRAKRAVAAGNEADAKDSLATAEALADKLLHSVGR